MINFAAIASILLLVHAASGTVLKRNEDSFGFYRGPSTDGHNFSLQAIAYNGDFKFSGQFLSPYVNLQTKETYISLSDYNDPGNLSFNYTSGDVFCGTCWTAYTVNYKGYIINSQHPKGYKYIGFMNKPGSGFSFGDRNEIDPSSYAGKIFSVCQINYNNQTKFSTLMWRKNTTAADASCADVWLKAITQWPSS